MSLNTASKPSLNTSRVGSYRVQEFWMPTISHHSHFSPQSFPTPTISQYSHFISHSKKIPPPQEFPFPPAIPTPALPTPHPFPTRNSHPPTHFPPPNQHFPAQSVDSPTLLRSICFRDLIAPVQEAVCAQPTFGGVGLGPVLVPLEHCRCTAGLVGASEEPRATGSHIHRCGHVSCYTQRCPSQPTAARAGACQESGPSPGAGRRADTGSFA